LSLSLSLFLTRLFLALSNAFSFDTILCVCRFILCLIFCSLGFFLYTACAACTLVSILMYATISCSSCIEYISCISFPPNHFLCHYSHLHMHALFFFG